MTPAPIARPPLTPKEGWLRNGHQVLRFRPSRWDRNIQRLEVTSGEWLPGESIPLLKNRRELSRQEAIKLWSELREKGWQTSSPQW
ncbi:hypothetical protein BBFGKLBO_00534 [Synechococcus sp. CBW1107]|uniref:DUF1651 domain-containing protein n=1 Tax=Synechococcus sp. CBW1107 TaxID=2789857 RepID=UPI002AD47B4D|nr:DUF1651 domain-containing protein [Synechococcus sp. CBW1107]CAK6689033.1 hypothetical protein BBFGKLBO_00534 [Synechococcus sp. CBW1107]